MTMTKTTNLVWKHPADTAAFLARNFEASLFTLQMELQGKTKSWYIERDKGILRRLWRDQAAAEEYIQHSQYLAEKYGGEIVSFDILDLDKDFKRNYNR